MRKVIKYSVTLLIIAIPIIGFIIYRWAEGFDWTLVAFADSPNKEFVVSGYRYHSDGDRHAPYGSYVFLDPAHPGSAPARGHVVFAGYCKNNLSLKWLSNAELSITCKLSEQAIIRSLSTVAYGVSIKFEPQ